MQEREKFAKRKQMRDRLRSARERAAAVPAEMNTFDVVEFLETFDRSFRASRTETGTGAHIADLVRTVRDATAEAIKGRCQPSMQKHFPAHLAAVVALLLVRSVEGPEAFQALFHEIAFGSEHCKSIVAGLIEANPKIAPGIAAAIRAAKGR